MKSKLSLCTAVLALSFNLLAQNTSGEWLEAEDYPSSPIKFVNDKNASGGMITSGTRWYRLAEVPAPKDKTSFYVYIYAKTDDNNNQYFHLSTQKRNYGKIKLPQKEKWCWAKLGPVKYDGSAISIRPNGKAEINNYLDGFVISKNSKLTPTQLNEIKDKQSCGQVAIGRCSKPPVIDGKLNDVCWKEAIAISPFMRIKSSELAKEQTIGYLTYDDKNIYAAFRCQAKVLDPLENRLHEFADKVKQHDSQQIFKDDSIMMLFSRSQGECFEITVNANGVIADAKCKSPNLWRNRDLKWNSQAIARGLRQNGFWTLEVAIPRTAIKSVNNDDIKFLGGRFNQAEKENSSFSKISNGFHEYGSFNRLTLREKVPKIKILKLPAIDYVDNNLVVELCSKKQSPLLVEQLIKTEGENPKLYKKAIFMKKGVLMAPVNPSGKRYKYTLLLRNCNNSEVLLRTPEYNVTPSMFVLKADIKSPAKSKCHLYVNGNRNNLNLNKGKNVVAFKAVKGTNAKFIVGNETIKFDSTWKFSELAPEKWNSKEFDTSHWGNAPVKNEILQKSGYLRKIIFVEETELWPNWKQHGVSICRNSIQQFFWPLRGLKGVKKAANYKMNIELPPGFEFSGASSYYEYFKTPVKYAGIVKRNGVDYKKYQIVLSTNQKYIKKLPPLHKYCVFAIKAPRKSNPKAFMYYYVSAVDSYIKEIPQKLKINLLPELKGKQPGKVIMQLWVKWIRRMSNLQLQKKLLTDLKKAGFNLTQFIPGNKFIIKSFGCIGFESYNLNFKPFLGKHPEMALINFEGKKSSKYICPSILLSNSVAKKYLESELQKWLNKKETNVVLWDYEYEVFNSVSSCFCPHCLKAFGHNLIKPQSIKKDFAREWISFVNSRMAAIAGLLNSKLHKIKPDSVFAVYSGYQCERTRKRYGVDWSKLKGKIQLAVCGYGRPKRLMEDTCKALGETKIVLGAIVYPHANYDNSYPKYCSASTLAQRILDSKGAGVMVFSLPTLDGRTFHAVSKISSLVSEYEDFFIKGKRIDSELNLNGDYAFLELGNKKLLILLNKGEKIVKYDLKLNNTKQIFDFYRQKEIPRKKISVSIPAGDIKGYLIE